MPMRDNDVSYTEIASLFSPFSKVSSWLILDQLQRKDMTAAEISMVLGRSQYGLLPELLALQKNGILRPTSRSGKTYFHLTDSRILRVFELINGISRRISKRMDQGVIVRNPPVVRVKHRP
jgi:hypothetical protein